MLAGRVWNIAYVSRHIECAGGNKVSASPLFNGARGVFVDLARVKFARNAISSARRNCARFNRTPPDPGVSILANNRPLADMKFNGICPSAHASINCGLTITRPKHAMESIMCMGSRAATLPSI